MWVKKLHVKCTSTCTCIHIHGQGALLPILSSFSLYHPLLSPFPSVLSLTPQLSVYVSPLSQSSVDRDSVWSLAEEAVYKQALSSEAPWQAVHQQQW